MLGEHEKSLRITSRRRVTEIRKQTSPEQWSDCPGKLNPAEDASRGLDMRNYLENQHWLRGPGYLWKTEVHWPEIKYEESPIESLEIKRETYLTASRRTHKEILQLDCTLA
jgi:hypothetical protein